jgi:SAM-dependent methyltransferase
LFTSNFINWITGNREWLFSGAGIALIAWLSKNHAKLIKRYRYLWGTIRTRYSPFKSNPVVFNESFGQINNNEWVKIFNSAEHIVEFSSFSMLSILKDEDVTDCLKALSRKINFRFKILLVDPESSLVRHRAYSFGVNPIDIRKKIYDARDKLSKALGPKYRTLVDIRTFSEGFVPYSLIRIDNQMLVVPYLSANTKEESPCFWVNGENSNLFRKYQKDFGRIWDLARPLHNQRVYVPNIYAQICSEKNLTAKTIKQFWLETRGNNKLSSNIDCLDIGCGDGTQSLLTFNLLAEQASHTTVEFLDPSIVAAQSIEHDFLGKKRLFTTSYPVVQRQWQNFYPDKQYDFILCSHVLGAIYQQIDDDELFHKELDRMISALSSDGTLCIVQASDTSIESHLRLQNRKAKRPNLSSERLKSRLQSWSIKFKQTEFTPFLSIGNWLGKNSEEPDQEERDLLYFLFAPADDMTGKLSQTYRIGLREHSEKWKDLSEKDKNNFLECNSTPTQVLDDEHFVKMSHVCFLIQNHNQNVHTG